MKKVTLLLAVALVFSFSFVVSANQAGDVEFVGEITYNTFDLTVTDEDGEESNMIDEMEEDDDLDIDISSLDSGLGVNAGAIYWLDSQIGLEAGIDAAFGSDSDTVQEGTTDIADFSVSNSIYGPYAKANFSPVEMVNLNAGAAYYLFGFEQEIEWSDEVKDADPTIEDIKTELDGGGLGFLLGADVNYPIVDNLSLNASANYRLADLGLDDEMTMTVGDESETEENTDENYNMSGLSLGAGVSYQF